MVLDLLTIQGISHTGQKSGRDSSYSPRLCDTHFQNQKANLGWPRSHSDFWEGYRYSRGQQRESQEVLLNPLQSERRMDSQPVRIHPGDGSQPHGKGTGRQQPEATTHPHCLNPAAMVPSPHKSARSLLGTQRADPRALEMPQRPHDSVPHRPRSTTRKQTAPPQSACTGALLLWGLLLGAAASEDNPTLWPHQD